MSPLTPHPSLPPSLPPSIAHEDANNSLAHSLNLLRTHSRGLTPLSLTRTTHSRETRKTHLHETRTPALPSCLTHSLTRSLARLLAHAAFTHSTRTRGSCWATELLVDSRTSGKSGTEAQCDAQHGWTGHAVVPREQKQKHNFKKIQRLSSVLFPS